MSSLFRRTYLSAVMASMCFAQTKVTLSERLPTVEEQLQDHRILLDRSSVIDALQDPDGDVRALAAVKLANDNAVEAIPQIAGALRLEGLPEVQIQMAVALAEMGDKAGNASLTALCFSKTQSVTIRLGAAQNMLQLHNEACFNAVLEIVQDASQHEQLGDALTVLSGFREVFKKDPPRVIDPMVLALADPSASIRISAAWSLGNLRAISSIPQLEFALANEHEEAVRAQMQLDLNILKKASVAH